MERSFGLVDEKLAEADFFLEKLAEAQRTLNFAEARFYFSAFISSARSVTFSLQSVMRRIEGFEDWYRKKQELLKGDPISRFFHNARTESQHIGDTPLNTGSFVRNSEGKMISTFYFSDGFGGNIKGLPKEDIVTISTKYFTTIVGIIFECYEKFGSFIDPHKYYTAENLKKLGLTIEDAEESLGLPRGWTNIDKEDTSGKHDEDRLRLLRRSIPGVEIGYILEKYLKK